MLRGAHPAQEKEIAMLWRGFQKPKRLAVDAETLTEKFGKFSAQPFERGFGTTIGNALRRTLLSSIEGAAVTAVRIEEVLHEFQSIGGVVEDATDIILNLKQIPFKLNGDGPKALYLRADQPGVVTSGMIEADGDVEILDNSGDGLELVQHAFDFYGSDGCSFDRAQHYSAECIADGGAEAALKRLRPEHAVFVGEAGGVGGETFRFLKTLPKHVFLLRPFGSVLTPCSGPDAGQMSAEADLARNVDLVAKFQGRKVSRYLFLKP